MKNKYIQHFLHIIKHKYHVLVTGLRIGGIPIWRLIVHDWTKFLPIEFMGSAKNYTGSGSPTSPDLAYGYGWLNHENKWKHHVGYWIPRSGPFRNEPLPMPPTYIREMVADMMSASWDYTGSTDMTKWLNSNFNNMIRPNIHVDCIGYTLNVLQQQGFTYDDGIWTYEGSNHEKII